MSGGDLRFHISRKTFTEDAVRFWIAELGCALRYIHSQNIIHRDVKPDNVLLDADGHVHLTDFVSCPGIVLCATKMLIGLERRLRHHSWQGLVEQVGHSRVPSTRSVRRQRLRRACGLVVAGCPVLRMHI